MSTFSSTHHMEPPPRPRLAFVNNPSPFEKDILLDCVPPSTTGFFEKPRLPCSDAIERFSLCDTPF